MSEIATAAATAPSLHINLSELTAFGDLNGREREIARVAGKQAAVQGYEAARNQHISALEAMKGAVTGYRAQQKAYLQRLQELFNRVLANAREEGGAKAAEDKRAGPPVAEVTYRIPMVEGFDINIPTPENILASGSKAAPSGDVGSLRLELPGGGIPVTLRHERGDGVEVMYDNEGRVRGTRRRPPDPNGRSW